MLGARAQFSSSISWILHWWGRFCGSWLCTPQQLLPCRSRRSSTVCNLHRNGQCQMFSEDEILIYLHVGVAHLEEAVPLHKLCTCCGSNPAAWLDVVRVPGFQNKCCKEFALLFAIGEKKSSCPSRTLRLPTNDPFYPSYLCPHLFFSHTNVRLVSDLPFFVEFLNPDLT